MFAGLVLALGFNARRMASEGPAKPFIPRRTETSPKWLRMWLLTATLSIQPLRRGLPNASISSSSIAGSRPARKQTPRKTYA